MSEERLSLAGPGQRGGVGRGSSRFQKRGSCLSKAEVTCLPEAPKPRASNGENLFLAEGPGVMAAGNALRLREAVGLAFTGRGTSLWSQPSGTLTVAKFLALRLFSICPTRPLEAAGGQLLRKGD